MPPRTLQIKVKPNARASTITETADGPWLAQLKSPPVDGKANHELISLLSDHFDCPKSAITIGSGKSSRLKLIRVDL